MSRLRARLERLERAAPDASIETVEIWEQTAAGEDRYTCAARAGEARTAAELGVPLPPGAALGVVFANFAPRRPL